MCLLKWCVVYACWYVCRTYIDVHATQQVDINNPGRHKQHTAITTTKPTKNYYDNNDINKI